MPVHLGQDGDLLRPGEVVICPGDVDSMIEAADPPAAGRLRCEPPLPGAHHIPSVDRAFSSVAAAIGRERGRRPADRDGTRRGRRHGGVAHRRRRHDRPGREHVSDLRHAARRHRRRRGRPDPAAPADRRRPRGSRRRGRRRPRSGCRDERLHCSSTRRRRCTTSPGWCARPAAWSSTRPAAACSPRSCSAAATSSASRTRRRTWPCSSRTATSCRPSSRG